MNEILVAIITGVITLVGVILTNNKAQAAADARQQAQMEAFQKAQETYESTQAERISQLEKRFDERMAEGNRRFDDLASEVREHNNYARRLPVLEEQMRVANHRISNLEHKNG